MEYVDSNQRGEASKVEQSVPITENAFNGKRGRFVHVVMSLRITVRCPVAQRTISKNCNHVAPVTNQSV